MSSDPRTYPGHCRTCGYWLSADPKLAGLTCTCPATVKHNSTPAQRPAKAKAKQ